MNSIYRLVSDQFEQQTGLKANRVTQIGVQLFLIEASNGCQYHLSF